MQKLRTISFKTFNLINMNDIIISNGNRTEWSTIQGSTNQASNFKSAERVARG